MFALERMNLTHFSMLLRIHAICLNLKVTYFR